MNAKFLVFFSPVMLLFSMTSNGQSKLSTGKWRFVFNLNDSTTLPAVIEVFDNRWEIVNAAERLPLTDIRYSNDSVYARMPVFDTELRGKISDNKVSGNFHIRYKTDHNLIPFTATKNEYRVSAHPLPPAIQLTGRWQVMFASDEPPLNISIGEFRQDGNYLTGTVLTSTGDFRYLEGEVNGSSFTLSCFDGTHLFLLSGKSTAGGKLQGDYYSGITWHDSWSAMRNDTIQLPDEDTLTFLKPGYDGIHFSFPNIDGKKISLDDPSFENKVVILQIMGSWCPNCMDETEFLVPYYKKNKQQGLEIIGLAFERSPDFEKAKPNMARMIAHHGIEYPVVFAGSSNAATRSASLPMMTDILSFPTTIFIDRHKKVRKIHTGFSGPATGAHYEKWKQDFQSFTEKLLLER